jgi:putative nucleotidyltransferase with HDIG domain
VTSHAGLPWSPAAPVPGSRRPSIDGRVGSAEELIRDARTRERDGCIPEAMEGYRAAIAIATTDGPQRALAEALRRLAVLHHHREEAAAARDLCRRSYDVAETLGDDVLAAEALNVLAGIALANRELDQARDTFGQALARGGNSAELRARIERNLGIIANIQGDHEGAIALYRRSLEASDDANDVQGRAIAYHNLGMVHADLMRWDEADRYFRESLELAESLGDVRLKGLGLVNHAEVHLARQHYEQARRNAEAALVIFDQLGSRPDKADAYRVIGTVYRETGRAALAESRLRASMELAAGTSDVLVEAEAARELAILYQGMGRNQEALAMLNTAHRLFRRLDARVDLVNVSSKVEALQNTFLTMVRDWGQSIESSDSYTHGHCERVASYAVAVARALGADEHEQTTIRIGAYLHDVGKVKVPHEILNKPGRLTREEFEVIQMHPVWGVELLATVEFPWDIKPIIRWHHEKYDGQGYPDRLKGNEIPTNAQVIGVVDVYDALTTTRSYRPAMSHAEAVAEIGRCRHWWRPDVYEAFMSAVGTA